MPENIPALDMKLQAVNLTRKFDRKIIFEKVNFELSSGSATAITGRNGSGKSTLIKIIANILLQSSGELNLFSGTEKIKKENIYK